MLVAASDLVEDPLLLSLLVHSDDSGLPFGVGPGNVEPGVGDEGGVAGGDSPVIRPSPWLLVLVHWTGALQAWLLLSAPGSRQ